MGERYWIHTPRGRIPLPGTLRPSALSLTAGSPNLVRARGYTDVYDLSDGLPDPVPLQLTGVVRAANETELNLLLSELDADVRAGTAFDRDGRTEWPLLAASLFAIPTEGGSQRAQVTVTLILARVPGAFTF